MVHIPQVGSKEEVPPTDSWDSTDSLVDPSGVGALERRADLLDSHSQLILMGFGSAIPDLGDGKKRTVAWYNWVEGELLPTKNGCSNSLLLPGVSPSPLELDKKGFGLLQKLLSSPVSHSVL